MDDASKPAATRVVEIPTGYTPGPWRAVAYGGSDFSDEVFTADGCQAIACAMSGFPPRKDVETDANARLIALAPDLAAAYQAQQAEIEGLRAEVECLKADDQEKWNLLEEVEAQIDIAAEIGGEHGAEIARRIGKALWDEQPALTEALTMSDAPKLLACPFCGGEAKRHTLNDEDNFGGDVIQCERCLASSHVEFGEKENLVDSWNRRVAAVEWRSIEDDPPPHGRIVLLGWCRWHDGDWMMAADAASWGSEGYRSFHGEATHWRPLDAEYEAGRKIAEARHG